MEIEKIELQNFLNNLGIEKDRKIAWGITGGGHMLKESIDKISEILEKGYSLDLFFSKAGKEVVKMFGYMKTIRNLTEKFPDSFDLIFSEKQEWSFPICGSFTLDKYSILIISPTTGNSVAKISYKIADTLITNIVAQSLKGNVPVIVIPTDFKIGPCETLIPGNKKILIHLHESDIERTNALKQMKGIYVMENPLNIIL